MKKILLCLLVATLAKESTAQLNRHIIWLKNKNNNPFSLGNPSAFLTQRAIDRRTRYAIPVDSTDLPVTPAYIDSIQAAGNVTVLNVSKWLNAVTIYTTDQAALDKINSYPFVQNTAPIAARLSRQQRKKQGLAYGAPPANLFLVNADTLSYGLSGTQVRLHNGQFLHRIGLRGQNMIIGVLDAGFLNYLTVSSLDSIRTNGQVLGTWDFVNREASVNEDHPHGMQVLSVMAANIPGQFVGTAPGASYYLFRSEDASSEYPIEEHNWVCAAERVDSLGGDLINSSLGYYHFDNPSLNYSFAQLDGNTTISARGADLAAKKGILVVNSAGNEGVNAWGRIVSPADGDSVLAVGAVNAQRIPASFTSRGPSADGQVKPDVASMGVATIVQFANNSIGPNNGTSFAAPNMAGLAACLWQGFREYDNMKIIHALRASGHRAANPNDTVGYGVPDVRLALVRLTREFSTASATVTNCNTSLNWTSKDMSAMRYEIERRAPGQANFIKVADRQGTGSIFQNRSYQLNDTLININSGNLAYRIRQIFDTSAAGFTADYIDTVTIALNAACITTSIDPVLPQENLLHVAPNPVRESLVVKFSTPASSERIHITISGANGQVMAQHRKGKQPGSVSYEISMQQLPAGSYFITVYDGSRLIGTKEIIRL